MIFLLIQNVPHSLGMRWYCKNGEPADQELYVSANSLRYKIYLKSD